MFDILDLDKNGYISQKELEKICIATRAYDEGDNFGGAGRNTYEKRGAEDAARLMKKLDENNDGKIPKDKLIAHLMSDPELQALQKRFNLNDKMALGNRFTKPGDTPMNLGDLIK